MKKFLLLLILFSFAYLEVFSQKDLTITREFRLFTSKNAEGYAKPLFTTLGQSFNTSLMNTAYVVNDWSFGIDISSMGMFIPKEQLSYQAELPDLFGNKTVTDNAIYLDGNTIRNISGSITQPTIYGGRAQPVFAAPQNSFQPDSFYKSVSFMEGNNIQFMSGLPVLQFVVGLPTRSQLRLRFFTAPVDNSSIYYYNIGLNQNIDRLFDLFGEESNTSLSLTAAYSMLNRNAGIDISSYSAGLWISQKLDFGVTFYLGPQIENISGTIKMVRDKSQITDEIINSPYTEIRQGKDLNVNVESFTSYRITGGLSFELGPIEIHADAAYASQPQINLGATIWLFKPEEFRFKFIPEEYKPIFKVDSLLANRGLWALDIPVETALIEQHKDKVFALSANVQAFGRINDIEYPLDKVKIEEYLSRQMRPLMPYIFFEENSSEIPSKYKIYQNSEEAKSFNYNRLLGLKTLETYYDILNIYGKRLSENPNAKITISGYKSNRGAEAKNKNISKQRAETIKNYLVNVWNINPNNITLKFGNLPPKKSNDNDPLGAEENRRVEIFSDNWEIMKPIDLQDTLRKLTPDKIVLKASYESDLGITNWQSEINEGSTNLKTFADKGSPDKEMVWDFANDLRSPKIKNNLSYYIMVEDKDGQRYKSQTKPIKVELLSVEEKRKNATKDTIINVYNLILFDFNKSTLDPTNKRITDIIKSEIPPNAIVKVTGYTDIIGKEDYNLKLSTARAKSTRDALDFPTAAFEGKGEYELLYDNSTPEGRYYCRTVVVEVRIPVNN